MSCLKIAIPKRLWQRGKKKQARFEIRREAKNERNGHKKFCFNRENGTEIGCFFFLQAKCIFLEFFSRVYLFCSAANQFIPVGILFSPKICPSDERQRAKSGREFKFIIQSFGLANFLIITESISSCVLRPVLKFQKKKYERATVAN